MNIKISVISNMYLRTMGVVEWSDKKKKYKSVCGQSKHRWNKINCFTLCIKVKKE
jgi:hypothetical protein